MNYISIAHISLASHGAYTYENKNRRPLIKATQLGSCYRPIIDLSFHPTHEQCMALRVVIARVLLRPWCFCYVPIADGTAISTW